MKPEITVSTSDLERLEGLLSKPPTRNRSDLDGLRAELERANILDTDGMPADVIMMNSRARFREETSGREYELTLAWPHEANAADGKVSIFSPAGSALLGLSVGQRIDWQTPEGHAIQLRVLAVSHGA
ncbi:nucleoside diphosphate kinase regulator [Zoogloea sp.]|jgi:regulator of nucleoside diphosphate kinase|uniref:nucleoside diphosphate kinase regulator n=1 Tax=Zoogloea sp. TaxID=49181 RepID=UPI001A4C3A54|nr:nucleoside diphosphate kinase regulator [uncultured Zoogloea sp.]MBL8434209.1 nucleoside diphosphate kinase regulator [Zoogloea sp.]MCK6388336.1 nucleoside diphosphate kinase regulator [Zoogloea sp.]